MEINNIVILHYHLRHIVQIFYLLIFNQSKFFSYESSYN